MFHLLWPFLPHPTDMIQPTFTISLLFRISLTSSQVTTVRGKSVDYLQIFHIVHISGKWGQSIGTGCPGTCFSNHVEPQRHVRSIILAYATIRNWISCWTIWFTILFSHWIRLWLICNSSPLLPDPLVTMYPSIYLQCAQILSILSVPSLYF